MQPSTKTPTDLKTFLASFQVLGIKNEITPAVFAIALHGCLGMHGIASQLHVIGRTTYGLDQDEISSSHAAHVFLRCMERDWDIDGDNAEERFIDNWFDYTYERTEFTTSPETVESAVELLHTACTPVEPAAVRSLVERMNGIWDFIINCESSLSQHDEELGDIMFM